MVVYGWWKKQKQREYKEKEASRQEGGETQLEAAEHSRHCCRFSLASDQQLRLCLVPSAGGAVGL